MAIIDEKEIAALQQIIQETGNAADQAEYEASYDRFFAEIDRLEEVLTGQKYLGGEVLSAADEAFFDLLTQWDVVWFFAYRLNRNKLQDFPALWRYARDIYQNAGGKARTDFEKIKRNYYGNLDDIRNPYHIIPLGPDVSIWEEAVS